MSIVLGKHRDDQMNENSTNDYFGLSDEFYLQTFPTLQKLKEIKITLADIRYTKLGSFV